MPLTVPLVCDLGLEMMAASQTYLMEISLFSNDC
jgi:hypothetical protein